MPQRTDVIYEYDGTLDGLLCCVFESFEKDEEPMGIQPWGEPQGSFWPVRTIHTDQAKARRVWAALDKRISPLAREITVRSFLICLPDKEMLILRFLRLGFRHGGRVTDMLTDETVMTLTRAVKSLWMEVHHLYGFVRFSQHNGALTGIISPKNHVLPLLANHFADRYPGEDFLLYDDVHKMALVHRRDGQMDILPLDDFTPPEAEEDELYIRALWKAFHEAIGIGSRRNPRCQMTMCPKRFWKHMAEMPDPGPGRRALRKLPPLPGEPEESCHGQAAPAVLE